MIENKKISLYFIGENKFEFYKKNFKKAIDFSALKCYTQKVI